MKKVLVTGGAGFIGSNVVEILLQEGWDVNVLDNLSTGNERLIPQSANLIIGDIRDKETVRQAAKNCSVIFHLAAFITVADSLQKINECVGINILGTANVIDIAAKEGVKRIVFSSSSAVYADTAACPSPETALCKPQSVYGQTKLSGEEFMRLASEGYGIETVCLRYFNVYGPGQSVAGSYPSVIPSFISRALKKEPLRIFGDGNQTRDFIFVKDVAAANLKAATANLSTNKANIWNIGCGIPTKIIELANSINTLCGQSANSITLEPPLQGDIYESCADIQLSQKQIPWIPTISLQNGLQLTRNGWMV
jgi:UDP-glucose 4-epimerase